MDIFEEEQKIYERAASHMRSVEEGEPYDFGEFKVLVKEYRSLLKQLRRMTKISDRTSEGLHENNLSLIDKVHYDTLTGIYSRRYMEAGLKRSLQLLGHSEGILSILMMDIDFFKRYNDTYGHSAGDDCLRAVAKALDACVVNADNFVARYGGEEFVAVLPNTDEAGVAVMAQQLLDAVRKLNIPHEGNDSADCVTISIGGTTLKPKPDHQFMDYIKRADIALYTSKETGRNKFTFVEYKEDMQ